jgi:hypothetical protein
MLGEPSTADDKQLARTPQLLQLPRLLQTQELKARSAAMCTELMKQYRQQHIASCL